MTRNQKSRLKNNALTTKKQRKIKGKPQIKGLTLRVYTMTPKKPNSALRKVAKVKLSNNKIVTAYIPGVNHTLTIHNLVLVQPGKTQDLPGLKYKIIRGVLDCK